MVDLSISMYADFPWLCKRLPEGNRGPHHIQSHHIWSIFPYFKVCFNRYRRKKQLSISITCTFMHMFLTFTFLSEDLRDPLYINLPHEIRIGSPVAALQRPPAAAPRSAQRSVEPRAAAPGRSGGDLGDWADLGSSLGHQIGNQKTNEAQWITIGTIDWLVDWLVGWLIWYSCNGYA